MTRAEFFETITAAVSAAIGGKAVRTPKEVTRGGLYAIEIPDHLCAETIDRFRKDLEPFEKQFGVKFMVLVGGATLRDPKAPVINVNMPPLSAEDREVIWREFEAAQARLMPFA